MARSTRTRRARPEQPPELSGADQLKQDIRIYSSAAVGVAIIRTREPYDARAAIEEYCLAEQLPLRVWNVVRGWQTVDTLQGSLPITDADLMTVDIMPALEKLFNAACPMPNTPANATPNMPDRGVFVMMWPDPYLRDIVQARAMLAELSQELQFGRQRLLLIAPPSFEIPDELAEMLPIVDFNLPTMVELRALYDQAQADAVEAERAITRDFTEEDVYGVCSAGAGMTRREFGTALCVTYSYMALHGLTGAERFRKEVLTRKTEVVKRSEVLEVLPTVTMDEIGGMDNLKIWLDKRRICFTEDAKAAGIEPPKGIGLIGPPGTGKSAIAKAVGSILQVPCVKMDISRVFGSLVGESEARMAKALSMLDAMAPCVAMVDEVDKVFDINSGGGDSGTSTRVLGKILTHMQETKAPIFWVLTANRTRNLPPELLRKGRLEEIWYVGTPAETEREAIFRIHLSKRGVNPDGVSAMALAIGASAGYVGGEIEAAVKDAMVEAYHAGEDLTGEHLREAVANMKPLSHTFKEDFEAMEQWAANHARPASSQSVKVVPGAANPGTGGRRRQRGGVNAPADDMAG